MQYLGNALTLVVAFIHVYIMMLEMFWWRKPRTLKAFGLTAQLAEQTRIMAANQGLYNGFLAAGLIWGVINGVLDIKVFFLLCVVLAGAYGAVSTKNRRILFIQSLPAALALLCLRLAV